MCSPLASPHGRTCSCFHEQPPTFRLTVPCLRLEQVHSPVVSLLLRVPSSLLPPSSFDSSIPAKGSVPHRGMTKRCPLTAGIATAPLRSAHRFSQPLDGFLHHLAPRVYSTPQPRPGFIPFRGFSLRAATLRFRRSLPPCRCNITCSPPVDGVRKRCSSTTRPSSTRRSVAVGSVISLPVARSPRRVPPSPRLQRSSYTPVPQCDPLMKLPPRSSVARWPRQPSSASFQ
jgi:hypothetical protein